jgi:chromosomal replication initiator protein
LTTSDREVVAALGDAIAQRIGQPRYNLWFVDKTKFTWQGDKLLIGVANHFVQEWLEKKFIDDIATAVAQVSGQTPNVRFAIDPELFQASRRDQAQANARTGPGAEAAADEREIDSSAGHLPFTRATTAIARSRQPSRRWRLLSEFVVGACNRVAHASALAVVESEVVTANPLVIHGPVGTGKTHLLEGIYAGLRKRHPDWRVCFITSEEFTNRFVQAMRTSKLGSFRKYFRDCDALLLDDLQFLATKRATQEEFLHTFDVLFTHDKPLALTCDCHPRLAGELSPELIDRLLGGATWGLEPPDLETRKGILRLRSGRLGLPIADELLAQVAGMLRGNVRELEGALQSIVHYSRVVGRPVDIQLVREALADRLRHAVRIIRLEDVDRVVCRVLRLESGVLRSKERSWAVSHPRMLAMFLSRKHTSAAYSAIGHYFGGLNHSSVVAAEKKIRCWLQENASLSIGTHRPLVRELVDLTERELAR